MILKFLKLSVFFFIGAGLLTSLGVFAFKILFNNDINEKLIVLGPDITSVYIKPKKAGGYEVKNLDIDILNNKTALIENEKLRPLPVKPELLPIETVKQKKELKNIIVIDEAKKENKIKVNKKTTSKNINTKFKNKTTNLIGMYRVQFGSFRDLNKANVAMKNMEKKHTKLLKNIKLVIFSYKNNDNLIFHRVWSSPLTKKLVCNCVISLN